MKTRTVVPAAPGSFLVQIPTPEYAGLYPDRRPTADDVTAEPVPVVAWVVTVEAGNDANTTTDPVPTYYRSLGENEDCDELVSIEGGPYRQGARVFGDVGQVKDYMLKRYQSFWDNNRQKPAAVEPVVVKTAPPARKF